MDEAFDRAHAHFGREKFDVAVCLEASAEVVEGSLVVRLGGLSGSDANALRAVPPLLATSEFELGRAA